MSNEMMNQETGATRYDFDLPKIKKLSDILEKIAIGGLILSIVMIALVFNSGKTSILVAFQYIAILMGIITAALWVCLWIAMKKSAASLITHIVILFLFGTWFGGLFGYLIILIATSQANTIIKNNGNVEVTFLNVKPLGTNQTK
jgi:hypothetical protein